VKSGLGADIKPVPRPFCAKKLVLAGVLLCVLCLNKERTKVTSNWIGTPKLNR